jgi:hypothetical protein
MPVSLRERSSIPLRLAVAAMVCAAPAAAQRPDNPMRFFEGRTESDGTIKLIAKRPFRSHAIGRGELKPDGTLLFVQHVEDEGRDPFNRIWRIRSIGPGRYEGTMSEARGPVKIDQVNGNYRFRFTMKSNVQVEQWLIPDPGWKSARNKMTIRKFGMVVGRADGTIRKLD